MKQRPIVAVFIAAVIAATLLSACAHSPPTRYLTLNVLDAPPSPDRPSAATSMIAPVQLTALHVPAELDRPQLVTHLAPNRYTISETERWAAPLAQLLRATLARDLQTRLPEGDLVFPDSPSSRGTDALVVDVIQVDLPAQGDVTLEAAWTIAQRAPDCVGIRGHATLRAPIEGEDATGKAAALSRALAHLADAIVSSLARR